jgi:hypothetical protein
MSQRYEIRIRGRLDQDWTDWFDGFSMRTEDGDVTVITVQVVDQPALFGVLGRIRDLNLTLISVSPEGGNS